MTCRLTTAREREQKLIDLTFEMVIRAAYLPADVSKEARAEWVAGHLRDNGFDTEPRGLSWSVLKNDPADADWS